MNLFVRGLWGEENTKTLPRSLREFDRERSNLLRPEPLRIYACGETNQDYLDTIGQKSHLLHVDPMPNWAKATTPRNSEGSSKCVNWGLSMWRTKLECIRAALTEAQAVVWLDADVHQVAPLPDDFWHRLAKGQPIQGVLRGYRRPQCDWRAVGRNHVPHGGFLYCRDQTIIERAIRCHEELHPRCTDEVAIAHVIDDAMGGWQGAEAYVEAGYSPPWYDQRRKHALPETKPTGRDMIFQNRGRY